MHQRRCGVPSRCDQCRCEPTSNLIGGIASHPVTGRPETEAATEISERCRRRVRADRNGHVVLCRRRHPVAAHHPIRDEGFEGEGSQPDRHRRVTTIENPGNHMITERLPAEIGGAEANCHLRGDVESGIEMDGSDQSFDDITRAGIDESGQPGVEHGVKSRIRHPCRCIPGTATISPGADGDRKIGNRVSEMFEGAETSLIDRGCCIEDASIGKAMPEDLFHCSTSIGIYPHAGHPRALRHSLETRGPRGWSGISSWPRNMT